MFDSIVNSDGDLLIVHFSESVDRSQSEQCYQLVKSIIEDTHPGFTVITDLGKLKHMDYTCADFVSGIMDLCNSAQVANVYRVIPNTQIDIGWNIMSKFHYDASKVHIEIFPTFFLAIKKFLVEKAMALTPNNY